MIIELLFALVTSLDSRDPWAVDRRDNGSPYFHDTGFNVAIDCDGTFNFVVVKKDNPFYEDLRRVAQERETIRFNMGKWHWRGEMTLATDRKDSAIFQADLGPDFIPALRQPQAELAIHGLAQTFTIDFRSSLANQYQFADACRKFGQ